MELEIIHSTSPKDSEFELYRSLLDSITQQYGHFLSHIGILQEFFKCLKNNFDHSSYHALATTIREISSQVLEPLAQKAEEMSKHLYEKSCTVFVEIHLEPYSFPLYTNIAVFPHHKFLDVVLLAFEENHVELKVEDIYVTHSGKVVNTDDKVRTKFANRDSIYLHILPKSLLQPLLNEQKDSTFEASLSFTTGETIVGIILPGVCKCIRYLNSDQQTIDSFIFFGNRASLSIEDNRCKVFIELQLVLVGEISSNPDPQKWNQFFDKHLLNRPYAPLHPLGKEWRRVKDSNEIMELITRNQELFNAWGAYEPEPKTIRWERFQNVYTWDDERGYLITLSVPDEETKKKIPPDLEGVEIIAVVAPRSRFMDFSTLAHQ